MKCKNNAIILTLKEAEKIMNLLYTLPEFGINLE